MKSQVIEMTAFEEHVNFTSLAKCLVREQTVTNQFKIEGQAWKGFEFMLAANGLLHVPT